ncbi:D-alanyl-D-alanine carboxypeptidase family protein [Virgibacillus ndiopensis]|uniref:D-alanyl-D-alanine carboxypeptidase family protein n=1 Tax=Virgibacillus ndiopensis TaxID=2004408 RepID=UPI000C080609|nr:D-alanyl-D-alanine carboxypeptidase family protein [Virgibacillus ndiopensis]
MRKIILILTTIAVLNTLLIKTVHGEPSTSPPTLVSKSAIMIDSKTGKVLYEKNASKPMYPASLTKIATAIFAIETSNLDEKVTVSKKARDTEGTRVYLEEGERVTLKKLLQGLLINSGNDAGVAIAEHLSGSVEQFSMDINQYLTNVIGVKNTHFENPHGLFDQKHVTTAEDLAKITQYAIQNETFRKIFGIKKLKWNGEAWDTTLLTHHKLMRQIPYEGITGGKTGYIPQSGFNLATTAERGNLSLIVITLNSYLESAAYSDTINLLDYGFNNFETSSISKGTTFTFHEQKYKTSKKLFYTHRLNNEVNNEVNENDTLEITSESGAVLASYPLKKVKEDSQTITMKDDVKISSIFGDYLSAIAFVLVVIVLCITGVFYRRKQKAKL